MPALPTDVDEDFAAADLLEDALNFMGTLAPGFTITDFLVQFIPTYATVNSTSVNAKKVGQNYITALYASQYVDPAVHPEYYFQNEATLQTGLHQSYLINNGLNMCPPECLDYTSTGNAMAVGDILNFDNTNTIYGGVDPGFRYFLNAEYHILEPDLSTVTRLEFTKTHYDTPIRFQLIIRYTDGSIVQKNILRRNNTTRRVRLRDPANIEEIVFAIYTSNFNPITSGVGRTFTVDVEAL